MIHPLFVVARSTVALVALIFSLNSVGVLIQCVIGYVLTLEKT
jgi:hypothetical protein